VNESQGHKKDGEAMMEGAHEAGRGDQTRRKGGGCRTGYRNCVRRVCQATIDDKSYAVAMIARGRTY
jgi:hypothetical protein